MINEQASLRVTDGSPGNGASGMLDEQTRLLIIEDNPGDALLIEEMLADAAPQEFALEHVERLSAGIQRLEAGGVEAVLVDLDLPDSRGLETFEAVRAAAPDLPVLVLTGFDDSANALEAVQKGAQDYIVKGEVDGPAIARSIRYSCRRAQSISEENERQRVELQVRDEFLSHVSHELRTPLTAVHDFISILVDGLAGPVTDEQGEFLTITLRNTRQLRAMIDDLLEVTRSKADKMVVEARPTRITSLVRQATESQSFQARAKSVALELSLPEDAPLVIADARRTLQVLTNLVENAIKFSELGAQVDVVVERWQEDDRFVCVRVADTGPGIPPDKASRIFEDLYRGDEVEGGPRRGLGVGLYLCKDLVVRQGGKIWLADRPGGGSVFSFTLPVYSVAEAIAPILDDDSQPEAFVLVSFEVASTEPSRSVGPEILDAVNDILERCAFAYRDALLPTLDQPGGTVFPVLLCGGERSASVFAERARSQLARLGVLDEAEYTCSVAVRPLADIPGQAPAADGRAAVLAAVRRFLSESEVPLGRRP